jgi:hypothetical protein
MHYVRSLGILALAATCSVAWCQESDTHLCARQAALPSGSVDLPADSPDYAALAQRYASVAQRHESLRFMLAVDRALDGQLDTLRTHALQKVRADFLQAMCELTLTRNRLIEARHFNVDALDRMVADIPPDGTGVPAESPAFENRNTALREAR